MTDDVSYSNAAKALHGILFGGFSNGFAVIEVDRKTTTGQQYIERHALPVRDSGMWLEALATARDRRLCVRVWPWVYESGVRRCVGTSAHNTSKGTNLRTVQQTVQVRWQSTPSPVLVDRFERKLEGHVVKSTRREHIGLIRLPAPLPIREVTAMADEVATSMGAFVSTAPLAVADGNGLGFLTDVTRAKQLFVDSSRGRAA